MSAADAMRDALRVRFLNQTSRSISALLASMFATAACTKNDSKQVVLSIILARSLITLPTQIQDAWP